MDFRTINNITGWIIFIIATAVYALTMESTASFWDCGEFILGAYKLEVVHPPGAPLFLILGRIFTLFAPSTELVPVMINLMSALSTSFAVLFIFWIITDLTRKVVTNKKSEFNLDKEQTFIVMASGIIGALACTFLDTLWFSAVEGEVYALSTFFIPFLFWCILKWEHVADEVHADRWLVFIAFMLGLSLGVHLMSLLAIPAIALVYYFKKYKPDTKGIIITLIVGFVILSIIYIGIVSVLTSIIAKVELLFVNGIGLPFGSGVVFTLLALAGAILGALFYSYKKQNRLMQTAILSVIMILIGFSTYFMVVIRSNANPPINMNRPDNVFSLLSYLNREQYGERPLLYGPQFTAYPIEIEKKGKKYIPNPEKGNYQEIGDKVGYKFKPEEKVLFPRMASWQDKRHAAAYRRILDLGKDEKPSFADNVKFFFIYQVGHMYLRYFMWNFSGRQNDNQGRYDLNNNQGGWITGFPFIDNALIGPVDKIPDDWKRNKAMNKFYLLPFLLGMLGLFFHFKRRPYEAFTILILFFFSGLMEIVYFNSPPFEPRERDYTLVGSFLTFTIWIGIGVAALYELARARLKTAPRIVIAAVSFVICLSVPYLMASEGWDDHDRSERSMARDFAINYLESCAPNAILFTQGDNDTYPLWYAQEVENIRPDVRVVNLSLLGVDWYIKQMSFAINDAAPVKLTHTPDKYLANRRDMVRYFDNKKVDQNKHLELLDVIKFVANDDKRTQVQLSNGEYINYLPVKKFKMDVNADAIIKAGVVDEIDRDKIVPSMKWSIKRNSLLKNDLMTYDVIASNLWERPIYFAVSVSPDSYMGLQKYFQLEGLAYRIVPIETKNSAQGYTGRVKSDLMYDNVFNKFHWGGLEVRDEVKHKVEEGETIRSIARDYYLSEIEIEEGNNLTAEPAPGSELTLSVPRSVYVDENVNRMTMNLRSNFARLAENLIKEGKTQEAINVLDRSLAVMPEKEVPYNIFMLKYPEIYYRAGANKKARAMVIRIAEIYDDEVRYHMATRNDKSMQQSIAVLQELNRVATAYKDEAAKQELANILGSLQTTLSPG